MEIGRNKIHIGNFELLFCSKAFVWSIKTGDIATINEITANEFSSILILIIEYILNKLTTNKILHNEYKNDFTIPFLTDKNKKLKAIATKKPISDSTKKLKKNELNEFFLEAKTNEESEYPNVNKRINDPMKNIMGVIKIIFLRILLVILVLGSLIYLEKLMNSFENHGIK